MSNIVPEQTYKTPRTTVKRLGNRGVYDRDTIHAIVDEALICHVGFVVDGQPFVIPTIHTRIDDRLYFHGSAANRMLRTMQAGVEACVTVTLLDGLVMARSAFHHSMNYRSAVILGTAVAVTEEEEKRRVLDALVEHVCRGRSADARKPNDAELKQTLVLRMPIEEASAKVRTGPPIDDEEDYGLPIWAGVLPLALTAATPLPDDRSTVAVPKYLAPYTR